MTKAQIMSALAEKTGLAKKEVVAFMDTLAEMAYAEVKKNGEFVLPGKDAQKSSSWNQSSNWRENQHCCKDCSKISSSKSC